MRHALVCQYVDDTSGVLAGSGVLSLPADYSRALEDMVKWCEPNGEKTGLIVFGKIESLYHCYEGKINH